MKRLPSHKRPEYGIKKIFPVLFRRECVCCHYNYKFTWMWQYLWVDKFPYMPISFKSREQYDYCFPKFLCLQCASTISDVIRYREGGYANALHKMLRQPEITVHTPIPEFEENL